jgi:hypothetical protein
VGIAAARQAPAGGDAMDRAATAPATARGRRSLCRQTQRS